MSIYPWLCGIRKFKSVPALLIIPAIVFIYGCRLDISIVGDGSVSSASGSYDCSSSTCSSDLSGPGAFAETFTAEPGVGQVFLGWEGACTGSSLQCDVDVPAALIDVAEVPIELTAEFGPDGAIYASDYIAGGEPGDEWTYAWEQPAAINNAGQYSISASIETTGDFKGWLKMGNEYFGYYKKNSTHRAGYFAAGSPDYYFEYPRVLIPGQIGTADGWPYIVLSYDSLVTPTGTINDVIGIFWLDDYYGPTEANDDYGLNIYGVTYAVDEVEWFARDIGYIQYHDIDASNGVLLYSEELLSTTVPH